MRNNIGIIISVHSLCYVIPQSRLSGVSMLIIFCLIGRVGLLAFHLALVNNPQDPFVVLAFASILYHGDWKEGIRFAKENAEVKVNFAPELSRSFTFKSDKQLVEEVSQLASFVQDSIYVLTDTESLFESMSSYPTSPCSGLVSICY